MIKTMTQSKRKTASDPEANWFGYRRVGSEEKTGMVQGVFSSVAKNYDLMNDVMSAGLHHLWKDRLVHLINPKPGQDILDVAGGTGDIALRCWRRTEGNAKITVCDLNLEMLQVGRRKAVDQGILNSVKWLHGNAEELPLSDVSFDVYCIAFGLRNVTHIDKALAEAVRVLKPGGRFFCMEFSPGVTPTLKPFYDLYCQKILPWLGDKIAKDKDAYQYLAESIQKFPTQEGLAKRMAKSGLSRVRWTNLTGGIAVVHQGWKI